jgi:hypothetical protein
MKIRSIVWKLIANILPCKEVIMLKLKNDSNDFDGIC